MCKRQNRNGTKHEKLEWVKNVAQGKRMEEMKFGKLDKAIKTKAIEVIRKSD